MSFKRGTAGGEAGESPSAACAVCEGEIGPARGGEASGEAGRVIRAGGRELALCAECAPEAPVFDFEGEGDGDDLAMLLAAVRAVQSLRETNELLRKHDVRIFNAKLTQADFWWETRTKGNIVICSNAFPFDLLAGEEAVGESAAQAFWYASRQVKEHGIDPERQRPFEPLPDRVEAGLRGIFRTHGRINPDTRLDVVARRFSGRAAEGLYPFLKWAWARGHNLAADTQGHYLWFWRLPAEERARYERGAVAGR